MYTVYVMLLLLLIMSDKDTTEDVVGEGRQEFEGVHHGSDEVVVPLDLRQDL